jgi:hypothetical protein
VNGQGEHLPGNPFVTGGHLPGNPFVGQPIARLAPQPVVSESDLYSPEALGGMAATPYIVQGLLGLRDLAEGAVQFPVRVVKAAMAALPYEAPPPGQSASELKYGLPRQPQDTTRAATLKPALGLLKDIGLQGYTAERQAIEAEGPAKVRAIVNLAGVGGLLAAGRAGELRAAETPTIASKPGGGLLEGRLLTPEEVVARRTPQGLDVPTFERRGGALPSGEVAPVNRVVVGPEGEQVIPTPAPRPAPAVAAYGRLSDEALVDRMRRTEAQIQRESETVAKGQFARQAADLGPEGQGVVTGMGRGAAFASGRIKQAQARYDGLMAEADRRGLGADAQQAIRERLAEREGMTAEAGAVPGTADWLGMEGGFARIRPSPPLSPAERAVAARIAEPAVEHRSLGRFFGDLYQDIVRRTYGLERAERLVSGGAQLTEVQKPSTAARILQGSARRAEASLLYGPAMWTAEGNLRPVGVPGLRDIVRSAKAPPDAFERYALSRRTLELAPRGMTTGIAPADAQAVVAKGTPAMEQAFGQYVQYSKAIRDYWAEAGGVSPEGVAAMDALHQAYVPLNRIFGEPGRAPVGRVGQVAQQLKRLTGKSERLIQRPLASTIDQTARLIEAADRNRVAVRLADLAEQFPERSAGLMERVKARPVPLAEADALQALAKSRGIDLTPEVAQELANQFMGFTAPGKAPGQSLITLWRNGARETWAVAPEIGRAFEAFTPQTLDWWVKLLGLPAQGLKAGVTLNPAFQVFNLIRDTFDATVQSRYGFRPGLDSFRGFYESAKATWLGKPSPAYQEFARAGGGFASLRGRSPQTMKALLRKVTDAKTVNPLTALHGFGKPFEEAARLGEFLRGRGAKASVVDALMASQDATVNFLESGARMAALNHIVAFLNPGIQSLDRAIRTTGLEAAAKGGATAGARQAARTLAVATGAIAVPSAILWLANRDDPEIRDMAQTRNGLIYWYFRLPKWFPVSPGEIVKLPKPFLWGQVFGTGIESALDRAFQQDPEAMTRWGKGVVAQLGTNVLPNAVQMYVEQKANRDQFFDTPIVPEGKEELEPALQYSAYTSRIARKLGAAINVSPARLEAVYRDLFGTLGGEALRLMDQWADPRAPTPQRSDWAVIGRFYARQPNTSVRSVRDFYDAATTAERVYQSARAYERERGKEAAANYAEAHMASLQWLPLYRAARVELAAYRKAMDQVRDAPRDVISPQLKRQYLDQLAQLSVNLARRVNAATAPARPHLKGNPFASAR